MDSKLVFSGVQPTGNLHLGNYLGAVKRFVELQDADTMCIYCLVDLHAITNWQDPKELRQNTIEVTAAFLACGLRQENSIIFNQSQVSTHNTHGASMDIQLCSKNRMAEPHDTI